MESDAKASSGINGDAGGWARRNGAGVGSGAPIRRGVSISGCSTGHLLEVSYGAPNLKDSTSTARFAIPVRSSEWHSGSEAPRPTEAKQAVPPTRLKDSAEYSILETRPVPAGILRDEVILLAKQEALGVEAHLRRIEIWLEDKQDTMVFLTNNMKLAASTIAAIYKERWQIELFFKALKQSLKIKTFVGTTENAVQTQIWTALIAMLMIKYLQMKSSFPWSLSNLVALLRQQLFVYRDLFTWLNDPYQAPPALEGLHDAQLKLAFGD